MFLSSDVNECASRPCGGFGVCENGANGYQCTCIAGYIGTNCQTGNTNTVLQSIHRRQRKTTMIFCVMHGFSYILV